jgi:hypothetical protein
MSPAVSNRAWFWTAVALTAAKLWLTSGQTVYAIGAAIHDDKLFALQAAHILSGNWLGPYNQFTLAKGPFFPLFLAGVFWIGLPLMLVQQLVYAGASAAVTRALAPWFRSAGAQFFLYTLLLVNPMSWDAGNLGRLMRQNVYTPLALLVVAGLAQLFHRRRDSWRRQAGPALLAGAAFGCFWLTREESVWLLPAVSLLLLGTVAALGREIVVRWRTLACSFCFFLTAALLPILVICTLNHRHYEWFGTVEFRASEFKDAYGALTRIKVGPELPHQVPVTRQMREAAYELSPAFAQLRPYLEGPIGEHWVEKQLFPPEERQIRGGWFVWAIRDAIMAAGLAPDAGAAMDHYRRIADEINAACDAGQVPAHPRRSGFVPSLDRDDVGPLWNGAVEYGSFFLFFKGFTAQSPDSIGDYAELKPFRDIVGTRLSHAPRSPDPFPPTQAELENTKVSWLEGLGRQIGRVLGWLGPLLLLTGLVRAVEAVLAPKVTFLLGFAIALLGGCAAYLAINVLVHVTAFYNMSPAAMASAYPLYLLALAAIGVDAVRVWSRSSSDARIPGTACPPSRWWLLVPTGAAVIVFAARLREIHLFASDVPFNDQWIIEAQQIIAPWLDGTLRPWTFFTPHFEHLPVWTRLLCWLQVVATGRWDPLVQMTVNAGLYAVFVFLATRWLWQSFSSRCAGFVTAVLILGGALPHAWENIAWGFQSQFPLALICLFIHVHGACTNSPGTRNWWLAQIAGLAGLFTLASMWLAPLAVVLSWFWTRRAERRCIAAPMALVALGITLLAIIHWQSPEGYSFAQGSRSPLDFLHSALHLLSWPSGLPGALAVLQLPWLVHALRLRGQTAASSVDRIIFALGLWNCAQAAGLAFARTGDTGDYVSRYGDVFLIGTLAGALALTRLVPIGERARTTFFTGALLWCGLVASGLFFRATEGHARYFHQTAAQTNDLRRAAVQAYVRDGDRTLLEKNETRWVLTQSTDVLTQLLDRADFREVLTTAMNPAAPDSTLTILNRSLQSHWLGLLGAGSVVLVGGLGLLRWRGGVASLLPPMPDAPDRWYGRIALATGLACTFGLLVWSNPLVFNRETRWRQMLGGDQALTGLTFQFATPSPFGSERLQGAAPLSPVELRNQFFGTAPAGPGLTCTAHSSVFTLNKSWLVVPYAGYPVGEGNGLRLQLMDDSATSVVTEIGCPGPNLDGIGYWPVDVSAHTGKKARLVLYDGRTDTQAWVAAAPPIPTDNSALATSLDQRLRREKHAGLHASLAVMALVAFGSWAVLKVGRKRVGLPD